MLRDAIRSRRNLRASSRPLYHFAWIGALVVVVPLGSLEVSSAHVDDLIFDFYQRAAPRLWHKDEPVRIVDIDDESIAKLGQWPWPRARLAQLVDRLREAKAAAVGFDIVFSEADRTSAEQMIGGLADGPRKAAAVAAFADTKPNDAVFAEAIEAAPVVLGFVLTQGAEQPVFTAPHGFAYAGDKPQAFLPVFSSAVVPLTPLSEKAAGLGFLNWLPDGDQIVRRVPLVLRVGDRLVPSLAMESLRVAQNASTFTIRASNASGDMAFGTRTGISAVRVGDIEAETGPQGDLRVRYTRHEPGRFVAAWKVFAGTINPAEIEDRVIVIGSSSVGLTDIRATPVDPAMPGLEIQAQVVENLVARTHLLRPDWAPVSEAMCGVLLAIALAVLLPLVPALVSGTLLALGLGTIVATSWFVFFGQHILLDPIRPALMVLAVYFVGTLTLFRAEQRGRRYVQDAFGRFVSPEVVARLADNPDALVLGGEQRPLTVMFTDIRGFSTIAEQLSAADLTRLMNRYLSPMSEIVLAHGGTVDKYIGDAIMAFWNAPLRDPEHARHAVRAALGMLSALPALSVDLAATFGSGLADLKIGIGLASGPCVVGNLGSRLRFDYSALGDDVNLASRLESATKRYGIAILAAESTQALAPDLAWLEVDVVRVAGRATATRVLTILGDETLAASGAFQTFIQRHQAMLTHYRARRFDEAIEAVDALRLEAIYLELDRLYAVYKDRCQTAIETPPPDDWDAVTRFEKK